MTDTKTTLTIRGRTYSVEGYSWGQPDLQRFTVTDVGTGLALTPEPITGTEPDAARVEALIVRLADDLDGGMVEEYYEGQHHLLAQAVGRTFVINGRWIAVRPSVRDSHRYSRTAWDLMEAGVVLNSADPFGSAPTLEQVTSYLTPRKRRLEELMVSRKILSNPDYQYEDVYEVLHGSLDAPQFVGIMHDETYSFFHLADTFQAACWAMASRLGEDTGGSLSCVYDLEEDAEIQVEAQATIRPVAGPKPVEVQQPGTHRETVRLAWTEVLSYDEEVEIDVPDGYEGSLWDLLNVDDTPATEGEVDGVPEGYVSNWIERASFASTSTDDREFSEIDRIDS